MFNAGNHDEYTEPYQRPLKRRPEQHYVFVSLESSDDFYPYDQFQSMSYTM